MKYVYSLKDTFVYSLKGTFYWLFQYALLKWLQCSGADSKRGWAQGRALRHLGLASGDVETKRYWFSFFVSMTRTLQEISNPTNKYWFPSIAELDLSRTLQNQILAQFLSDHVGLKNVCKQTKQPWAGRTPHKRPSLGCHLLLTPLLVLAPFALPLLPLVRQYTLLSLDKTRMVSCWLVPNGKETNKMSWKEFQFHFLICPP